MRIAVTYENGQIFQHFGRTEQFKLYDVADGKIINEQPVEIVECTEMSLAADRGKEQAVGCLLAPLVDILSAARFQYLSLHHPVEFTVKEPADQQGGYFS